METAREFYRRRYTELSSEGSSRRIAAVVNIDIEVQILDEYKALSVISKSNDLLFCGGCGEERDFIVETDSNSGRACKNPMCKEK